MRHTYIIALLLIICSTASAQVYQRMPQYGYQMPRAIMDSVLQPPTDTVRNKTGLARIGTQLYAGNGSHWTPAGSTFDTTYVYQYIDSAAAAATVVPDTLVNGVLTSVRSAGAKKYAVDVDTTLLQNRIDSTVAAAGGGTVTLQQAFDADPTAGIDVGSGTLSISGNNGTFYGVTGFDGLGIQSVYQYNDGSGAGILFNVLPISFSVSLSKYSGNVTLMQLDSSKFFIHNAADIINFGINTNAPTAPLHVVGPIRFEGNGAAAGYVWTATDAAGNGQWQAPSGGGSGISTGQLTDSLNNREPRYKFRNDSTGNAGYTTLYQRNKLKDSLQTNINAKANNAGPTFTDSLVLTSTVGGMTLPSMTQTQMNAITPRVGTQVFNTTYNAVCTYVNDWGWWSIDPAWLTYNGWQSNNEFIVTGNSATTSTVGDFYARIVNSGTVTSSPGTANRPGIIQLSSASSANSRAVLTSDIINGQTLVVGGGRIMYEADVQVPTLSSSSETFRFFTGLSSSDQVVSASSIAFLYDSTGANTGSAAIGRWQVVTSNGTTRSYTTTDSTVTAGQWYRLRAVVNAAGTQVDFYINGTLVKSETNNIPTAAMSPMAVLTKSNGTTARTVLVDFIRMRQKFTTAR